VSRELRIFAVVSISSSLQSTASAGEHCWRVVRPEKFSGFAERPRLKNGYRCFAVDFRHLSPWRATLEPIAANEPLEWQSEVEARSIIDHRPAWL